METVLKRVDACVITSVEHIDQCSDHRFVVVKANAECFYVWDRITHTFEQFGSCDVVDSIFTAATQLPKSLTVETVYAAEPFVDRDHSYYYAFLRLSNPDVERSILIALAKDIHKTQPDSFNRFRFEMRDS